MDSQIRHSKTVDKSAVSTTRANKTIPKINQKLSKYIVAYPKISRERVSRCLKVNHRTQYTVLTPMSNYFDWSRWNSHEIGVVVETTLKSLGRVRTRPHYLFYFLTITISTGPTKRNVKITDTRPLCVTAERHCVEQTTLKMHNYGRSFNKSRNNTTRRSTNTNLNSSEVSLQHNFNCFSHTY
jgi:hypothetical protein